ncbi:MAG: ferritin [Anaerolineales bacterium]
MFPASVQDALNKQINMEMGAYYTYLSMAAYFEDQGLKGFATWMYQHAEEEMVHAMKIYDYVHTRRGRVKLLALGEPPHEWASPLAAFEDALKHEEKVTKSINEIVRLARDEGDWATDSFLQWFVDEQVEEEEVVDEAIRKLKLIGDFSPGLYLLDREMEAGHAEEEGDET